MGEWEWDWASRADEPPERPRSAPRAIGRYLVEERLGEGAFGEVYRARDPDLGRAVAIKLLRRSALAALPRFEREVRLMARLRHPGLIAVHEAGVEGGRPYLVMDYVEGRSLAAAVGHGRPMPPVWSAEVVRDVARAVAHAHERGVIHRDLKPANIILDAAGRPHVTDFGLGWSADDERLTRTGAPLGTPAFMAPEQVQGRTPDRRTDVYGLGATLYRLLSGRVPFEGCSAHEYYVALLYRDPPPPSRAAPDVPPALDAACARCLARDPRDRYPTAEAVAEALDAFVRAPRPAEPRRGLAVAAALGVAAAAALGGPALVRRAGGQAWPATGEAAAAGARSRDGGRAASARPAAVERARRRAWAGVRAGSPEEAVLAAFARAEEEAGTDPRLRAEVVLDRNVYLKTRGRIEEVVDAASDLRDAPGRVGLRARFQLRDGLGLLGRAEAARSEGRALVADDPDGYYGLVTAAELALADHRPAEAAAAARRAIELEPDGFTGHLMLGYALLARRDLEASRGPFERAAELRPWDPASRVGLGSLAALSGEHQAALRHAHAAFQLAGPDPHPLLYHFRSKVRVEAGDLTGAVEDLDRALALRPDHPELRVRRGLLRWQRGQRSAAVADWRRAARSPQGFERALQDLPPDLARLVRRGAAREE